MIFSVTELSAAGASRPPRGCEYATQRRMDCQLVSTLFERRRAAVSGSGRTIGNDPFASVTGSASQHRLFGEVTRTHHRLRQGTSERFGSPTVACRSCLSTNGTSGLCRGSRLGGV